MLKISKYAIFNYEESDSELIEELAEYLDVNADKVFQFFGVPAGEKAIINIVPTKKEFDRIFREKWGYDCEDWAVGFAKNGEITYLSLNDYKNTKHAYSKVEYYAAFEHFKKTLLHEFVHYVNELFRKENDCGSTVKYLREGIATYLSGQKDNAKVLFDFSIDDLLATDMKKSCYNGYYLITKYLIENYDKDFVMELFKSNRKATEFLLNELYEKAKEYYVAKPIKL